MLWALWKGTLSSLAFDALHTWSTQHTDMDAGTLSFGLMLATWMTHGELEMLLERAMQTSTALQLPDALLSLVGSSISTHTISANASFESGLRGGYGKLARMLQSVEDVIFTRRSSVNFCQISECITLAVEEFALRGSWLKVAGDEKARVLEYAFNLNYEHYQEGTVVLEYGTFVGYSTVRLSQWLVERSRRLAMFKNGNTVVSLELDPVHACLARHILTLAELAPHAEVLIGLTYDTQAQLSEIWGAKGVGFTFMDHRGTKFHDDMHTLEALDLPVRIFAAHVADNVLKPGAPLYLWGLRHSTTCSSNNWSLMEFLHEAAEDWMAVSACSHPIFHHA